MAEVLSQSEIDALLSAISTGDVEPEELLEKEEKQKVKKYDFRSPQKFSKEHIKALELIHDNFSRVMSNFLSAQIRKNIKVEIQSVEQITYHEFINSIPNPTVLAFFKMPPLQGSLLMDLNSKFCYQILDTLLGGNGERENIQKEFSEIDKNILTQVGQWITECFGVAWKEYIPVEPEFENLETNPGVNLTLSPNEPVALLSFSAEFNETISYLNLCIPYLSVEKLIDKLIFRYKFESDEESLGEETKETIMKGLSTVDIPVVAEVGSTVITVDDFLKLGIGDVLKLDNLCTNPIDVLVDNKKCFIAKPGIIGKNMGIEVLDIIDKGVSTDE
ncbi:MAG: flagellar motor switch protein FliM [Clostridium sp.]